MSKCNLQLAYAGGWRDKYAVISSGGTPLGKITYVSRFMGTIATYLEGESPQFTIEYSDIKGWKVKDLGGGVLYLIYMSKGSTLMRSPLAGELYFKWQVYDGSGKTLLYTIDRNNRTIDCADTGQQSEALMNGDSTGIDFEDSKFDKKLAIVVLMLFASSVA